MISLTEQEIASLPDAELTEHIDAVRDLWIKTQRACITKAGADPDIFLDKSMSQSELFMCDIIPVLHDIFFSAGTNAKFSILDVGPQTFSGTRLLAALHHPNSFSNLKFNVSTLDIHDKFKHLKRCICPDLEFIKSDIYNIRDRTWDAVIASHVIEHVPEPAKFARHLQSLANTAVIIACPWNENPITTKGHQNTISKSFVRSLGATSLKIYTNVMWGKSREVCIFTLSGKGRSRT